MAGTGTLIGGGIAGTGSHPFGLFMGSLDVLKETTGPPNGFGVDVRTIEITEAGPGGVSSMTFTIDDPGKEISIVAGTDVSFWNLTGNSCLFRGWVDHYSFRPDFGGQGRTVEVDCVGVEAILDWTIVPAGVTIPFGNNGNSQVGFLANQFAPILKAPSQLSVTGEIAPFTRNGSFDYPIGCCVHAAEPAAFTQIFSVQLTTQGGTLRQEINRVAEANGWVNLATGFYQPSNILYTVDFYFGLRAWEDATGLQPDDYSALTINDAVAATPPNAASLAATTDWNGVIRTVYIAGGNAAGSGYFGDGSGIQGPAALITDTTILTTADAVARALGYMTRQAPNVRGTFRLENFTPNVNVHAGSFLDITDAATGLSTTQYRIMEIRKTFQGNGKQNWDVTFGGLGSPSVTRLTRRFTRSTLN